MLFFFRRILDCKCVFTSLIITFISRFNISMNFVLSNAAKLLESCVLIFYSNRKRAFQVTSKKGGKKCLQPASKKIAVKTNMAMGRCWLIQEGFLFKSIEWLLLYLFQLPCLRFINNAT